MTDPIMTNELTVIYGNLLAFVSELCFGSKENDVPEGDKVFLLNTVWRINRHINALSCIICKCSLLYVLSLKKNLRRTKIEV